MLFYSGCCRVNWNHCCRRKVEQEYGRCLAAGARALLPSLHAFPTTLQHLSVSRSTQFPQQRPYSIISGSSFSPRFLGPWTLLIIIRNALACMVQHLGLVVGSLSRKRRPSRQNLDIYSTGCCPHQSRCCCLPTMTIHPFQTEDRCPQS
jgi:hypothetical protein